MSNLNIKCLIKLERYIDFCINNNLNNKIKAKTSHHHILPASKNMPFIQFSNLKENVWNGTHLTYANHYYAHWLLYEAINHQSVVFSFCAMHYKDFTLKRIKEEDLLPPEIVQECMENRSIHHKEWLNTLGEDGLTNIERRVKNTVLSEETLKKKSDRMKGGNNIVHISGVVEKILKTKSDTIVDGKNMHTVSAERAAKTMIENGTYKESGKKHSNTLKTIVEFEGKMMSMNEKLGIERSRRETVKGKKFVIRDVFNEDLEIYTYHNIVASISTSLPNLSKENHLGKQLNGAARLLNHKHLIGLYVEEVNDDTGKNFILDLNLIINQIQNKELIYIPTMYEIKSVFDESYNEMLTLKETAEIHQNLHKRTKEVFLYKYKIGELNRGLYTNNIFPASIEINKTAKKI